MRSFAFFLLASLVVFIAAETRAATLRNNWIFDADFTDSVGGLNGTASNNAVIVTTGAKFGAGALSLDGNDAVDIGNVTLPASNFTWSAWIYTANTNQSAGYIMSNQDAANYGAVIRVAYNQFFLRINGYSGSTDYTATNGSYYANTWTHVALSIDGANGMTFYVNGILVDSNAAVVKYLNNTTVSARKFAIGSSFDASGLNGFDGLIDDVAIFNGVLSSNELSNVIAAGAVNFETGPPAPAGTLIIIQ